MIGEPFQHSGLLCNQVAPPIRDAVSGSGDAHEYGVDLLQFQSLIELLGLGGRRTVIAFSNHHDGRRLDVAQERDRRVFGVFLGVLGFATMG